MLPPYKLRYPKDLFSDLYRYISPWDIEKLSTEILINSSSNKHCPQTLANWKLITKSVNQIKSIEDQLYFNSPVKDVRFELFRISQLQFPEQVNTPNNQIIRFYNLYKSPLLRKEIEKALSINLEKLYTIALLIQGFFIEKPRLDTSNIADIEHITSIEISRFIEQFSTDIHNIRKLCSKDIYTIDYKYQFHFNPTKFFPLIKHKQEPILYLPISENIISSVTSGLYYRLVDWGINPQSIGEAFQAQVDELIENCIEKISYDYLPEYTYKIGKNIVRSNDHTIYDKKTILLVDSKLKRFSQLSKTDPIGENFEKDLNLFAQGLSKLYTKINDIQSGVNTKFTLKDKYKFFPILLLATDTFIFGDMLIDNLTSKTKRYLTNKNIDEKLVEEYPFTILSLREFEILLRIFEEIPIDKVMTIKTSTPYKYYSLDGLLSEKYWNQKNEVINKISFESDNFLTNNIIFHKK